MVGDPGRVLAQSRSISCSWDGSWVEQMRVGGVLLADLRLGFGAGNLIRLTRTATGQAEGRFDAGQGAFMPLRHNPGRPDVAAQYLRVPATTPVIGSSTRLDPRLPWTNPVVWFLTANHLESPYRLGYTGEDPEHDPSAVFLAVPDGSSVEVTLAPNSDGTHTVEEKGPRRLWAHVEHAHQQWATAGRPAWPRLGVRVTATHHTVFVDFPDNPLLDLPAGGLGSR